MILSNLITDDDLKRLHELKELSIIVRNKGASLVREINKMLTILENWGKIESQK